MDDMKHYGGATNSDRLRRGNIGGAAIPGQSARPDRQEKPNPAASKGETAVDYAETELRKLKRGSPR